MVGVKSSNLLISAKIKYTMWIRQLYRSICIGKVCFQLTKISGVSSRSDDYAGEPRRFFINSFIYTVIKALP